MVPTIISYSIKKNIVPYTYKASICASLFV